MEYLDLVLEKSMGRIKAINSTAELIVRVVRGVTVKTDSFKA